MSQFDLYSINAVIVPKETPQAELDKIMSQSQKYCPLLKEKCRGFQCAWFAAGFLSKMEDPEKLKVFFGQCKMLDLGRE